MFNFQNLYLFFIASLLLNLTPGNDMLYVASRSISQGIKAGITSAAGIFIGCFVHILAAVLGLSIIISRSVYLFQLIKFAGAAYLIYLGVKVLLSKPCVDTTDEKPSKANYCKLFKQGIVTNVLNPKVAVFFLSFLPQFINSSAPFLNSSYLRLGFGLHCRGLWCLSSWPAFWANRKIFSGKIQKSGASRKKLQVLFWLVWGLR